MPIDERFSTGNRWECTYGYSRAVRSGRTILTTGTVSMNGDGTPFVPDDARAQALRCLEIVERGVLALGGTREDILRTRFYVTCIERADAFGRAHREFFGDHAPCLTMVEVARLMEPGFLVEIEADAMTR